RTKLPQSRQEPRFEVPNEKCQSALTDWHCGMPGLYALWHWPRPAMQRRQPSKGVRPGNQWSEIKNQK
ncbi:hypothetical protein, partial [Xanthomonas cucurbitae]|uniref:hypothetical protein n=1 Tax=Xanthomonas cucurbitae TaxID=56453 RepID=UPI001B809BA5